MDHSFADIFLAMKYFFPIGFVYDQPADATIHQNFNVFISPMNVILICTWIFPFKIKSSKVIVTKLFWLIFLFIEFLYTFVLEWLIKEEGKDSKLKLEIMHSTKVKNFPECFFF